MQRSFEEYNLKINFKEYTLITLKNMSKNMKKRSTQVFMGSVTFTDQRHGWWKKEISKAYKRGVGGECWELASFTEFKTNVSWLPNKIDESVELLKSIEDGKWKFIEYFIRDDDKLHHKIIRGKDDATGQR